MILGFDLSPEGTIGNSRGRKSPVTGRFLYSKSRRDERKLLSSLRDSLPCFFFSGDLRPWLLHFVPSGLIGF
jgi:hypothetical protein